MKIAKLCTSLLVGLVAASVAVHPASPPTLVNYQGVLRNATDEPLSGTYDMVFRFYSASMAGAEILIDNHTAALGGAVTVSGGLFNVQLGGGSVADGSGAGTYATLAEVFRDHAEVYLSIEVGSEVLAPRIRIVAAAYALNAGHLDGKGAAEFVDTSAGSQTKSGNLTVSGSMTVGGQVQVIGGSPSAGRILTTDATGLATWQDPVPGPQGPPGPAGADGPPGPAGFTGRPVHSVAILNPSGASPPDERSGSSVVIGADGLPLVAFNNREMADIQVTHCSDPGCTSGVTTTLAGVRGRPSLAIQPNGLGVFCASSPGTRVYACDDADCSSATLLEIHSGVNCSLAIGTDGVPLVSLAAGPNLVALHCGDSTCTLPVLTTIDSSAGTKLRTSLAIGGDGLGLISYIDDTANSLKVAHCTNTACTAATITIAEAGLADVGGNPDQGTSIAISPNGLGVIAYYDAVNGDLRVVFCNNALCSASTKTSIDTTGDVGTDPAITIGSNGFSFISYRDDFNRFLKVAYCNSLTCSSTNQIRILDDTTDSGWGSSVTVGTDGFPVVVHWNQADTFTRLVHCSNLFCLPYVRSR